MAAADLAAGGGSRNGTQQLLPEGLRAMAENDGDEWAASKPAGLHTVGSASAPAAGQRAGAGTQGAAARKAGRQRGWGIVFHSPYFRSAVCG